MEARDAEGCAFVLLSNAGAVHSAAVDSPAWDASIEVPRDARYVRAQLVDGIGEVQALTNPVWAEQL